MSSNAGNSQAPSAQQAREVPGPRPQRVLSLAHALPPHNRSSPKTPLWERLFAQLAGVAGYHEDELP
jgi:hypothetical protein